MGKSKKSKGSGKNTPKRGNGTGQQTPRGNYVKASDTSIAPHGTGGFSLRDATRRPEYMSCEWTPQMNLRHKPMAFVKSHDTLNLNEKHESTSEDAKLRPVLHDESHATSHRKGEVTLTTRPSLPSTKEEALQPDRQTSPALSISSDEVVFTGRGKAPAAAQLESAQFDEQVAVRDCEPPPTRTEVVHESRVCDITRGKPEEHSISSLLDRATLGKADIEASSRKSPPASNTNMLGEPSKAELQADYIRNMEKQAVKDEQRSLLPDPEQSQVLTLVEKQVGGWKRQDLEDLADLSTSDETQGEISMVLGKRERATEMQYLIVWAGTTPDEARWIRRSALDTKQGEEAIRTFEQEERDIDDYRAKFAGGSSDDTDNGQALSELAEATADDDDDWEDDDGEDDSEDNAGDSLSDAMIARLLAKQEELGMGGDELLIHDGDNEALGEIAEGYGHDRFRTHTARAPRNRRQRKSKWREGIESPDEDDELFGGHDYNSFDVMDWERASVAPRRKSALDFELSDSELEQALRDTWSRDRQKKKVNKQEREELRSQGLLGKSPKVQNLAARYGNGFSLGELRNDIADFLESDRQTLDLPPLDKKERKVIHEIAAIYNCKSKSSGSGRNRYPVLTKTRRTLDFDDTLFDRMERKLGRRILGGNGAKYKPARPGRSGRGANGGIHYREGETVGAGAAELGADNRGRAMLEKMGWSKGTALGALNNKGIMMPIEHIVKTSRAGLG